jgi:gamma-tubulin complex component 3
MVSDTVRRIVKELAEVGWLYKKITNKFNEEGAVTRALNLAIKDEMGEYYRWLAIIENMIKNEELTLRKLILWSYEPFEKLKWLAIILETARPFQGCQIISIINSYRPQGSNSINSLLNRLLGHLLQPLFQYIYNWVYRGELIDPNN